MLKSENVEITEKYEEWMVTETEKNQEEHSKDEREKTRDKQKKKGTDTGNEKATIDGNKLGL